MHPASCFVTARRHSQALILQLPWVGETGSIPFRMSWSTHYLMKAGGNLRQVIAWATLWTFSLFFADLSYRTIVLMQIGRELCKRAIGRLDELLRHLGSGVES